MLRPEMDTEKQAQAAAAAVDTRELVSLLQQMVRIRSYSAGGEEGTIARFMRDYLAKLGLEVELQEVQPDRFNCVSRMPGTGGGTSLMLNGHLDTNPAGEGWTKDPLAGEGDGDFIYGIGARDRRGGLRPALPSVYAGPSGLGAGAGSLHERARRQGRGRRSEPATSSAGLPIPDAVPEQARADLRGTGPAAPPRWGGALDCLPYPPGGSTPRAAGARPALARIPLQGGERHLGYEC